MTWTLRRRATPNRWELLGDYNAEVYRGIVHTPEYDARMAIQQRLFNAAIGGRKNK
jgi:hypothetical protein